MLWLVGLVLTLFVIFGIFYQLPPVVIAIAAGIVGWVVAERNALRTRLVQWPILQRYIDRKLVQADLSNERKEA